MVEASTNGLNGGSYGRESDLVDRGPTRMSSNPTDNEFDLFKPFSPVFKDPTDKYLCLRPIPSRSQLFDVAKRNVREAVLHVSGQGNGNIQRFQSCLKSGWKLMYGTLWGKRR